ncbi:cyclopropane-fatty-acyl-phospholipid synthase [Auriscalpium vulgare]|uniref:Cyclopropane-fatty-acyl-phospholipid synthase n=1 Tax=Auriscalpium vulgare TaxID=40419 RepID=A0ACB8S9J4_9AGAM|nr:cyclopropane-fatty-acyl-phospholipid synthase [Auriscalpium vulgare]
MASLSGRYPLPSFSLRRLALTVHDLLPSPASLFTAFARTSIVTALETAIAVGRLEIEENGTVYHFGQVDGEGETVHIDVVDSNFWSQVLLHGDLGFSEAYMIGDIRVNNLDSVMNLWLNNEEGMTTSTSIFARITSAVTSVSNALLGQTRANARLNAIASYDQSNELFKAFLSKEMMYSCALWGDEEGGPSGDLQATRGQNANELEAAQLRKIRHVLQKANLKPGDRLLEFGSGWGGLAIEAVRSCDCEVDTLTLSIEQKKLAEERIREAGLEGRIRVHLLDYRELPPQFEKAFDAFISIEMLEHVGTKYYHTYFKIVDWALKPGSARAVVSSSTFPDSRYTCYQAEDFMRKYMWPNSCLPSPSVLITAAHEASQGRFKVDTVENHAAHYPRTLREWDRRLDATLTQKLVAADIPALRDDPAAFKVFKRKWRYLFAYAAAGLERGYIGCHMLSFNHEVGAPSVA